MEAEPEPRCRICFDGPVRGLADALIMPCGCLGSTGYTHVSCLDAWQLEKVRQLRDAARCEICNERYQVPPGASAAWAAAGGADGGGVERQQRLIRLWQVVRPVGVLVARGAWWLLRTAVVLQHGWTWLGLAANLVIEAEDVPQLAPGVLPPAAARARQFVQSAARLAAVHAFMGAPANSFWRVMFTAAALLGAHAVLPRLAAEAAHAGAGPARDQALGAEACLRLIIAWSSLSLARVPAFYQALLGPLLPNTWLAHAAATGHRLLSLWAETAKVEAELQAGTAALLRLFAARPVALAALHAALLPAAAAGAGRAAG